MVERIGQGEPRIAAAARARRSALLVGLDTTSRRVCRETLDRGGFAIETTDSGVAAVAAVRARVPDVIFVGRQLRDVTGREVMRWLRTNPALRRTPIIAVTDEGDDGTDEEALTPGIRLLKPVSVVTIARALATFAPASPDAPGARRLPRGA